MKASPQRVGARLSSLDGIATAVLDEHGVVLHWSREAADLLDRTAAEVCGKSVRFLLADGPEGRLLPDDGRTAVPAAGRAMLRHRSGDVVEVAFRVLPLKACAGFFVLAVATDATEDQRARHQLDVLQQAAARIGRSLDVNRTAQDLANVLVPALGDLAWVELAEAVFSGDEPPKLFGGGNLRLRRAAVASASTGFPATLIQPGEAIPSLSDSTQLQRLQSGEALITDREMMKAIFRDDPEGFRLFVPEGGHSAMWAPLFERGLVLGVIGLWRTERPEPFDKDDAALLTEIASRAAVSIDNARRYTRERHVAVALQQRLLPRATTDTPAAQTAGFYLPAGGGADIGGDWFDVIPLPGLRTAFVVGDVIGHGLHATATMGRLRTAVRTLADLELEPTELLTHLDSLVIRLGAEAGPDRWNAPDHWEDTYGARCLYAIYDPVARRCIMASAGHPPPVLLRTDGSARVLKISPGPPLGIGGMPFETTIVDLEPGSVLALYTDGLITRDDPDPDVALRHLTDRLTRYCRPDRPLDDTGHALLADADAHPPRDDIALLLARTRALPAEAVADWEFPADPAIVADARKAAISQLNAWGLQEVGFTTELIVSELVTNAVRYGGGPIGLRLIRDEALICEVTDTSNTQPRLRRARTTDEGGRGLFLVAQLTTRWGSRYGQSGKTIWAEESLAAPELATLPWDTLS